MIHTQVQEVVRSCSLSHPLLIVASLFFFFSSLRSRSNSNRWSKGLRNSNSKKYHWLHQYCTHGRIISISLQRGRGRESNTTNTIDERRLKNSNAKKISFITILYKRNAIFESCIHPALCTMAISHAHKQGCNRSYRIGALGNKEDEKESVTKRLSMMIMMIQLEK